MSDVALAVQALPPTSVDECWDVVLGFAVLGAYKLVVRSWTDGGITSNAIPLSAGLPQDGPRGSGPDGDTSPQFESLNGRPITEVPCAAGDTPWPDLLSWMPAFEVSRSCDARRCRERSCISGSMFFSMSG